VFGSDTIAPILAEKALLLTGTPMINYVHDLYTQLHFLDPDMWPSFEHFVADQYFPGCKIISPSQIVGVERNLERLRRQLQAVMIRRPKSVLKLPPKTREIVEVDIEDSEFWSFLSDQAKCLRQLQQRLMRLLDKRATEGTRAEIRELHEKINKKVSYVRHQVGMNKLPAVIEYLRGRTGKTLVFAYHHDVIARLMEALVDQGVSGFTGSSSLKDRDRAADKFQHDPNCQFFIGNIEAAGQGITLTAARHVVFAEPDWRGTYLEQAEDRAHRIGQTHPVLVTYLLLQLSEWSTDSWMELVVVDTDRHGGPDGVAAMRKLVADHGNLPDGPRTNTAGEGLHLIFKQPDGVQLGNREGSLPDGINVRGAGGYVVGPGAVRPDEARYRGAEGAPDLAEAFASGTIPILPGWLADIIRKSGGNDQAGPAQALDLPGDRERAFAAAVLVKSIVELEQAGRGTRNNTLNSVAYRLGRMIARGWIEELAVVDGLSQACRINGLVSDDGLEPVRSTIKSGLTAGRAHPHSDLEDRPYPQADDQPGAITDAPSLIPVVWDGEAKHNPTKWLVRDLIPMGSIGLIVGEASAGKSFAAIDLARALARGGTFLTKAARKGGTLYVAAEAAGTIPGRLEAARLGPLGPFLDEQGRFKNDGREPDRLPICVISHPPGLLNDNEVNRLIATAIDVSTKMQERFEVPLRLIIIDTLLAAFSINDWNSPAEVSRVMDVLASIAQKTGAVVLGVHHHGKDVSRGPAGSFALKAASDVVLSVFAETDNEGNVTGRRITVSKLRDGQTGWGCDFELVPHKIGTDDEGIHILSAYLEPTKATAGFGRPRPSDATWRRTRRRHA
jgi:hypothetical protein